jgi:membrane fusion protein, multidrug efflux system
MKILSMCLIIIITQRVWSQVTAPVKVAPAKLESISQTVDGNGVLEPQAQADVEIAAVSQMRIEEILVSPGESVKKGQQLVRLQRDPALEGEAEKSKINLDQALVNLDRSQRLFDAGVISRQQFEQTKTERDLAQSEYDLQKRNLEYAIKNSLIRSPLDGVVASVDAVVGQVADPAKRILRVINPHELVARLGVEIEDISKVREGQAAEVTIPNLGEGNTFSGRVSKMNREIDPSTQLIMVWVKLESADSRLQPGSFVSAQIVVRTDSSVVAVPQTAVLKDEQGSFVFVVEKDAAHKLYVETGVKTRTEVEILKGLRTGQSVVWQGNYELEDGMKVRVEGE